MVYFLSTWHYKAWNRYTWEEFSLRQSWKIWKFWCTMFCAPCSENWCTCAPQKNVHSVKLFQKLCTKLRTFSESFLSRRHDNLLPFRELSSTMFKNNNYFLSLQFILTNTRPRIRFPKVLLTERLLHKILPYHPW